MNLDHLYDDQLDALAIAEFRTLKASFSGSRLWEAEKLLGHGSFGFTALLRDKSLLRGRSQRKYVLKRSLVPHRGTDDITNEIGGLELLRGSTHLVNIIASTGDVAEYRKKKNSGSVVRRAMKRLKRTWDNPPTNVFKVLSISEGPAMLLEYIPNGSLLDLMNRANRRGYSIPNRILWSFYLCLVRACVGMAYPLKRPAGEPQVLEEILRGVEPFGAMHNDVALRNIMVDETEIIPEHYLIPKLKLIDFGIAEESESAQHAIRENLWDITREMISIIKRRGVDLRDGNWGVYNGVSTYAVDVLPRNGVNPFPTLDPELRLLLVEAMALGFAERPSLRQMLRRTRDGAAKPAAAYHQRALDESDMVIKMHMQQLLYDAA
ncbi:hypothetical protein F5Y14DRAFT_465639 [Nemania sp. NC0429]|nr:hypothetical protein F5Y14DRAFT_465639 [Nemania sp. NC0429]